jgi:hypothetical protein
LCAAAHQLCCVRSRGVGEDEAFANFSRQSHHLRAQCGDHDGRQLANPRHRAEPLDERPHVAEWPTRHDPGASMHRSVADADAQPKPPAGDLLDERVGLCVVGRWRT